MPNRRIKVAVIGIGSIATRSHIPAYLSNEHVELVALVDVDKKTVERAARKFGIKEVYSTVERLFEEQDLDAISICTPPHIHSKIALTAFANDVHVLCEKPLATTVNDGIAMYEAAEKKGKILSVGFNLRFRANYRNAKRLILSGGLGLVYSAEVNYLDQNPLISWGKSDWFFRPEMGGGVLADKGPHVFDMLNYVFGDFPLAISAQSYRYFNSSVEDFCSCMIEYPNDKIGIGVMSWLSSTGIESLSIHGSAQSLYVTPNIFLKVNSTDISEVSLWKQTSEALIRMKFPNFPILPKRKDDTHRLEINDFVQQVRQNSNSLESALNGLNVLITHEAAKKSLERKERITITPFKKI